MNDSARTAGSTASDRRMLIDSIVDRLTAMYARRHRAKEGRMARLGVSMTHLQALVQLADGPMTMTALARALDASPPSMSGIVDRIEARGLIERDRSSDDRRVVQVHLTQAGRDWLCEMETVRRDKMERVLGQLDDERLGRLSAALDDLLAAFVAAESAGVFEATTDEPTPDGAPTREWEQVTA